MTHPSEGSFRAFYERHVGDVAAGNLPNVLADIAPDRLPAILDGVSVPRGDVAAHAIVGVHEDRDRWFGETVYETGRGAIGLRSIWERRDDGWKAVELHNFEPQV